MEYIQIYADVLLHHKAKQKWNRILSIASIVQNYSTNSITTRIFELYTRLEFYSIIKSFLNVSNSELQYSYKRYSYKSLSLL